MIEAVFFDLSGVLYTGTTAIDGAVDAIDRVQASSLQVRFVTNTSRQTRADLLKGLLRMGFDLSSEQLYTAPSAALSWVVEHGRRPYCLVHENILPEFSGVDQSSPDAVIIGDAADDLNYKNLNHAFQLCQQGAVLIGIGRNRYFKQNDELVLDAGPFINAIEYAADTEAIIMGKPSPAFFRQIVNSVDCKASEVLMMGDDVFGDVEGALRSGLQACLVQTGKYQLGDETRIDGVFTVYPSIVEAVDMLLGGHIQ